MRFQPLLIAALLFACANPDDNQANEAANDLAADGTGSADAPIEDDDSNGGDATLPPPPPGAPPPQDPPAPEPEPDPERSVTLSVAPARAAAGATMTLTLENGLRQPIGYNLCTSGLIRNGAPVETGKVCTLELRTLRPGDSTTYGWELPDNLAAGNYRFTTGVERMRSGNRLVARSNGFRVTGP